MGKIYEIVLDFRRQILYNILIDWEQKKPLPILEGQRGKPRRGDSMKNKIDWEKIKVMIVETGMENVFEMKPKQVAKIKLKIKKERKS